MPSSGRVTWYLYYLIVATYIVDGYKSPDSAVSSTFNTYHKGPSLMQWFSHQFHSHCCLTSWLLYGPTDRVTALFFKCGLLDDPCQNFLFPHSPLPHLHLPYSVIHLVYIHRTQVKRNLWAQCSSHHKSLHVYILYATILEENWILISPHNSNTIYGLYKCKSHFTSNRNSIKWWWWWWWWWW